MRNKSHEGRARCTFEATSSSAALKIFNNYNIIMTSNRDIRSVVLLPPLLIFGCSSEFHAGFEHFDDLKNFILNVLKEKSFASWALAT